MSSSTRTSAPKSSWRQDVQILVIWIWVLVVALLLGGASVFRPLLAG